MKENKIIACDKFGIFSEKAGENKDNSKSKGSFEIISIYQIKEVHKKKQQYEKILKKLRVEVLGEVFIVISNI